jgi:hypothetical protein
MLSLTLKLLLFKFGFEFFFFNVFTCFFVTYYNRCVCELEREKKIRENRFFLVS